MVLLSHQRGVQVEDLAFKQNIDLPSIKIYVGQLKGNKMSTKTEDFANLGTFGEFEDVPKANKYIGVVTKLAEMNSETASFTLTANANDADKEKLAFQQAANEIGKTARLRITDDTNAKVIGKNDKGKPMYEGTVNLTFTLTHRHKARRGQKNTVTVE